MAKLKFYEKGIILRKDGSKRKILKAVVENADGDRTFFNVKFTETAQVDFLKAKGEKKYPLECDLLAHGKYFISEKSKNGYATKDLVITNFKDVVLTETQFTSDTLENYA